MKKFISLALATAMIASMSVPAFAFNVEPISDGNEEYDVKDVRISRRTVHRVMDSGVRVLFFPFELKGADYNTVRRPIIGGDNNFGEKDMTFDRVDPVYFANVKDFQELTWTVKFDKDCEQFLRVAEQIHDCPTFIVVDPQYGAIDPNGDEPDNMGDAIKNPTDDFINFNPDGSIASSSGKTLTYTEMEGLKVVLNDNNTTDNYRISGTITLKHKGKKVDEYDFSYNFKNLKFDTDSAYDPSTPGYDSPGIVMIDHGKYEVMPLTEYGGLDDFYSEINDDTATIDLRGVSRSVKLVDFGKDVEEIELEDHHGFYFNVKASDQGKMNLSYENNINYTNMWMAMYYMGQNPIPAGADVRYFNFKAKPEFDFTGKVTIELPDPDVQWYLYDLDPNAISWSPIEHAVLTEEGDAFEFKARKLGCYMLSDVELVMPGTEGTTEGEVEDVNPSTGGPEEA